jgi:acetate kinase
MLILVLNFRIHSAEYELFHMPDEKEICSGAVEKIGLSTATINHRTKNNKEEKFIRPVLDYTDALRTILDIITDKDHGVIRNENEIDGIGHRIVHGGEKYFDSVIITAEVKKEISRNFELAPLHNPYNYKGIEAAEKLLPNKPQVAVFDTSFHHTIPEVAYRYPIPQHISEQYRIRKYGFHGISHKYVAEQTALFLKKPVSKTNIISMHLGEGASLCAIKNGISIDTSMGFTPLEGLMMTTRTGEISTGVILHLLKSGMDLHELETCFNKESGILGISGISDNVADVVVEMNKGNQKAKLAIDMFVYRIRKYFAAYYLLFGGKLDAISFTGGIGQNSAVVRSMICDKLDFIGIKLNPVTNKKLAFGHKSEISDKKSDIRIFVIPRNEKFVIARDTARLIKNK